MKGTKAPPTGRQPPQLSADPTSLSVSPIRRNPPDPPSGPSVAPVAPPSSPPSSHGVDGGIGGGASPSSSPSSGGFRDIMDGRLQIDTSPSRPSPSLRTVRKPVLSSYKGRDDTLERHEKRTGEIGDVGVEGGGIETPYVAVGSKLITRHASSHPSSHSRPPHHPQPPMPVQPQPGQGPSRSARARLSPVKPSTTPEPLLTTPRGVSPPYYSGGSGGGGGGGGSGRGGRMPMSTSSAASRRSASSTTSRGSVGERFDFKGDELTEEEEGDIVPPMIFSSLQSPITAAVYTDSAIPHGVTVVPFLAPDMCLESRGLSALAAMHQVPASAVGRCDTCQGFMNPYVKYEYTRWLCPLCGGVNDIKYSSRRYQVSRGLLDAPEYEYPFSEYTVHSMSTKEEECPRFVAAFIVDLEVSSLCLKSSTTSIAAALRHMPSWMNVVFVTVSDRVGVVDVGTGDKAVIHQVGVRADGSLRTPLGAAFPRKSFTGYPVTEVRKTAAGVLASLRPTSTGKRVLDSALEGIIESLCGEFESGQISGARIECFIGGPSTQAGTKAAAEGAGRTPKQFYQDLGTRAGTSGVAVDIYLLSMWGKIRERSNSLPKLPPPPLPAAIAAAREADTLDGISTPPLVETSVEEGCKSFAIETLLPLVRSTGGMITRYNLYRREQRKQLIRQVLTLLTSDLAIQGVLRLRMSADLDRGTAGDSPDKWYGCGVQDSSVDNLHHLAGATWFTCLSTLFSFNSVAGFAAVPGTLPTFQLAFEYSTYVARAADGSITPMHGMGARRRSKLAGTPTPRRAPPTPLAPGQEWLLVRRLRIVTMQLSLAEHPRDMFPSMHHFVVLQLICHQGLQHAREGGHLGARDALVRWFINLLQAYHMAVRHESEATSGDGLRRRIEATLHDSVDMQRIARHVYGLLHLPAFCGTSKDAPLDAVSSPVQFSNDRVNPDEKALSEHWLATAAPDMIWRCAYPVVTAFATASGDDARRMRLNAKEATQRSPEIGIVQAGHRIVLYANKGLVVPDESDVNEVFESMQEDGLPVPNVLRNLVAPESPPPVSWALVEDMPLTTESVTFRNLDHFIDHCLGEACKSSV